MFYHVRQLAHPLTSSREKWKLPNASELLDPVQPRPIIDQDIQSQCSYLERILTHGNTIAQVKRTVPGPFITQFWVELKTKSGKRLARPDEYFNKQWSVGHSEYITEKLHFYGCRVVTPSETQSELLLEFKTNNNKQNISLREVIESDAFQKGIYPLTIPLGLDVEGRPAVADLSSMPHLLIMGTTGAGKSVFLHGMILGLILKETPEDLQFIMLGGMLELAGFQHLPHLLGPHYYFEKFGSEVMGVLSWLEAEQDQRLSLMASAGYEDFWQYNASRFIKHENTLPRIVVIVEHYFDFSGYRDWRTTMPILKEVDPIFIRLVQTAHRAGIHFVITNQNPSHKDMSITLKDSFQARIGFAQVHPSVSVMSLGKKGTETLAFHGDMLFRRHQDLPLERYQACNINSDEKLKVVEYWHRQEEKLKE